MEKQIRVLEQRQAQLRERRATLETSRADTHKSGVSIQHAANSPTTSTPCVSLHRPGASRTRSSQMFFTPAPGHHGPRVHPQWRTGARPRATTSTPPVFKIFTWNRSAPIHKTERNAVIVGDSIVRQFRATLDEGKMHTHCFPGAHVHDVSAQIPAILKADESPRAVVLHARVNDTMKRQTETLKRDFRSLIEMVHSTTPAATIIVSRPLPTYRRGHERLFHADGLHPSSRSGAGVRAEHLQDSTLHMTSHRSQPDPVCIQIRWSLQSPGSSPYPVHMVDQHLEMTSTALNVSGDHANEMDP
uniref:SGNH hydrolase-type esterase domain-containing protein n=1 Tax=Cyprinus carpio carpio TaxID=630221 RepID=A0A9J7ZCV9_CYPCA